MGRGGGTLPLRERVSQEALGAVHAQAALIDGSARGASVGPGLWGGAAGRRLRAHLDRDAERRGERCDASQLQGSAWSRCISGTQL